MKKIMKNGGDLERYVGMLIAAAEESGVTHGDSRAHEEFWGIEEDGDDATVDITLSIGGHELDIEKVFKHFLEAHSEEVKFGIGDAIEQPVREAWDNLALTLTSASRKLRADLKLPDPPPRQPAGLEALLGMLGGNPGGAPPPPPPYAGGDDDDGGVG